MNEDKRKHLEFIQLVITRMNVNSFLLKGWAITLTAALFALAAKDSNVNFVIVAYLPTPIFWVLDAYYLAQERQYRELYNHVRTLAETDIDFDMNATGYNNGRNTLQNTIVSKTLWPFYGGLLLISSLIMLKFW